MAKAASPGLCRPAGSPEAHFRGHRSGLAHGNAPVVPSALASARSLPNRTPFPWRFDMAVPPDWQLAEQQSLNPPAPSVRPSSPMALVLRVLIAGRQPRLATKRAWFWLAFMVLEPTVMWSDQPQPLVRQRLTGGWAFLLTCRAWSRTRALPSVA